MFSLDTNICIALLKGEPAAVDRLRGCSPATVVVCAVVRAELQYGARKSAQVERNLGRLDRFLAPLHNLPFDERAAAEFGLIRVSLERAGQPIGAYDLLIAAIARAHDLTVVTRNHGEFARVPGLRVEVWD